MGTVFEDMLADNDRILVTVPTEAKVITFSNSGRGGKRNWFAMTTDQLRGCLEDMLEAWTLFHLFMRRSCGGSCSRSI